MTEIAVVAPPDTALTNFVTEASQVYEIAKALANTSFVPTAMRGKPQEITGAILFGRELDLPPMTALQTINIIGGRPTLSANAMRGLAMGAGVRFRLDESTETRCVMSAIPPGSSEWTTVTWTIDQARKLDLLKKDNWRGQPGVMLIARATSQLCRLVAANILIGSPYSTEEIVDLPTEPTPPAPVRHRVVTRKPLPVYEEPEPELVIQTGIAELREVKGPEAIGYSTVDDERRTGPEDAVPRPDMMSAKLRAAVMAAFHENGIRDRNPRLKRVSEIVGREVLTLNQLTHLEGLNVLHAVSGKVDDWPPVEAVEA